MSADARRAIPSVERLLAARELSQILDHAPRARIVDVLREIQDEMRNSARDSVPTDPAWYAEQVTVRLARAAQPSLRSLINVTGVVLHTNLGRAPLAASALDAIRETASGYANLEYDLASGRRGSRYTHCADLLCKLTGAQAALVVNNNAAAVVLAVNTLAWGKPVLISRGELVEIGDSFRIAEIVSRSGAIVREVGATNRTHIDDYTEALGEAAAILKVHPSNYQTSGFVSAVTVAELAPAARAAGVPLVYDLGSGLIDDLQSTGLPHEPTARQALADGADVVTMSGDKLLGGPQAGILLGSADLITRMQRNPLCRALRVDKMTLAALEATLQCYARGDAFRDIPALRMLAASGADLRARAQQLRNDLVNAGVDASLVDGSSAVGGGAYPAAQLATTLVRIDAPRSATEIEARLREGLPPVVARVVADHVVIDVRTLLPGQAAALLRCIVDACS